MQILGVGFWTYCLRKSITVFLGCAVKTEKILSANVSEAALEEIAQDRRLELDHNENTQFTLRVREPTLLSKFFPSAAGESMLGRASGPSLLQEPIGTTLLMENDCSLVSSYKDPTC